MNAELLPDKQKDQDTFKVPYKIIYWMSAWLSHGHLQLTIIYSDFFLFVEEWGIDPGMLVILSDRL